MPSVEDKRKEFRRLHESGCFAIPNPWDIGSARYLQHLGFKAIATTSAGFAFSRGLPDGAVKRDDMLAHIKELVDATKIPVNADFENGYADDPDDVAESVRLCVATGVAGLSIEDAIDRKEKLIYDVDLAVERIRAAREAIGNSGVLLVGRAEGFLVGRENIDQVIKRLVAYSEAGAIVCTRPVSNNAMTSGRSCRRSRRNHRTFSLAARLVSAWKTRACGADSCSAPCTSTASAAAATSSAFFAKPFRSFANIRACEFRDNNRRAFRPIPLHVTTMLAKPNETEISHGRVFVANTLKLSRQGAVGFIDWLGRLTF
jgi:2-methylisocitrate lyase-like PEP mutase family enzyme